MNGQRANRYLYQWEGRKERKGGKRWKEKRKETTGVEEGEDRREEGGEGAWLYKPVSHIWALITLESTSMLLVSNSTPMVDLCSRLNSLRVKRDRRLDLPTPESPISTTRAGGGRDRVEREGRGIGKEESGEEGSGEEGSGEREEVGRGRKWGER